VPFFRKPPKSRPSSSRPKPRSPSPSTSSPNPTATTTAATTSSVVLPLKKPASNLLTQGTRRTKRERVDVNYGSGTAALPEGYSLSDEEREEASQANARKRAKLDPSLQEELPDPDDGLYHGLAGYKSHIKVQQEMPKTMRSGPVRANPSTIRQVTITDYQPDVCKDYKETGYCGFGDTCKFLHDRGTYLAGWQLDRQWEEQQRAGASGEKDADSSDEEEIPFACLLCRKPYADPIVTKCGHYFCSKCAIQRFRKTPKCAACGQATGGMFNGAAGKVEGMRRRMTEKARKEAGEE
ncbi:hypothetical protein DACRYDRAFT_41899, partial [Dacryopinax primogenitus]